MSFALLRYARGYVKAVKAKSDDESKLMQLVTIALAALEYGASAHRFDPPCHSHPVDCAACASRRRLEALVGGPLGPDGRL